MDGNNIQPPGSGVIINGPPNANVREEAAILPQINNAAGDIQRVGMKVHVPQFWPENPEIWFAQIEAQFYNAQVRTDNAKFNTIVGAMDSKILSQVSDAVLTPPDQNKYENLKRILIQRFSDSEQMKARKLLSQMTLGDQRPSHLLNQMRHLAGVNLPDEFLKTLWLANLPTHASAILSTSDSNLAALGAMADKILEVGQFSNINSVETTKLSNETSRRANQEYSTLERKIEQLSKQIQELSQTRRSRSQSRRNRSCSTSKDSIDEHKVHDFCWYHFKFGSAATKCKEPCKFKSSKN